MRDELVTLLVFLAPLLAAGCSDLPEPAPQGPGGILPIEVENARADDVVVEVRILHPAGRSEISRSSVALSPGTLGPSDPVRVPHGAYIVAASSGSLTRERTVEFGPDTAYYRFVVQDDVIAFRQG